MDEGRDIVGSTVTVAGKPVPQRETDAVTSADDGSVTRRDATIGSPHEALLHAEILRTRNFCIVGTAIAIVGLLAIPRMPGGYITTRVLVIGMLIGIAGLAYLYYRTRRPATFYEGYGVALGWYIPVLSAVSSVPYFGPFSPVCIVLVLGIFFNGLGASKRLALATYLTCAAAQGITGALVVFGVIEDTGFILGNNLSFEVQLVGQLLIQMVLLGTFIIARASRASSLAALSELEKAVRAVAQREALLDEARAELRRALGTGRGRFTDQRIGNFLLGDVIGRGAMGEVYQGVDVRDDQQVAVKMLGHSSLGNAQHVQRFLRELQTAAAISSPHVVRVIAVGEHPLPHLVMERLRGRDLATTLRAKRTLEPEPLVELLHHLAEGITAAAKLGIVHRDIKPQNIFQAGATWKILDFGISRVATSTDTLTADHIVGTPAYMAPEQARGDKVDHRADLYSIAAVAYRALTGHQLFASNEIADTVYRVVHAAPQRPSSLAQLPRDVDLALAIGLAKDPADRFATAAELADAIAAALSSALPEPLRERGRKLESRGAYTNRAWEPVR